LIIILKYQRQWHRSWRTNRVSSFPTQFWAVENLFVGKLLPNKKFEQSSRDARKPIAFPVQ